MKKTLKKPAPEVPRFVYPKEDGLSVGCKVSWLYYKAERTQDAKEAAKVAKREALYQLSRGYDFGYMAPGDMRSVSEGKWAGHWEVCIP